MNGSRRLAGLAMLAALCLMVGRLSARAHSTRGTGRRREAPVHHGGIQRLHRRAIDENPTQQIKQLDDFVAKYPNSALPDLHLFRSTTTLTAS